MKVGIIGLGIMGGAYARNLCASGHDVQGCDPSPEARARAQDAGAKVHETPGAWLSDCAMILISVAKPDVLHGVATTLAGLIGPDHAVIETGTFALADKEAFRDALAGTGAAILDCPVSGTGAQAAHGDLVMMASGDAEALDRCRPALSAMTKSVIHAGPFGAGMKMKMVANHAVAIHNCAAAETLAYALRLGLDARTVYEMLSNGAGQSKMSDLRMPLMIDDAYRPPTASLAMFDKDMAIIGASLRETGMRAPLFDACDDLYRETSARLPQDYDTAAVYEVYRDPGESA